MKVNILLMLAMVAVIAIVVTFGQRQQEWEALSPAERAVQDPGSLVADAGLEDEGFFAGGEPVAQSHDVEGFVTAEDQDQDPLPVEVASTDETFRDMDYESLDQDPDPDLIALEAEDDELDAEVEPAVDGIDDPESENSLPTELTS